MVISRGWGKGQIGKGGYCLKGVVSVLHNEKNYEGKWLHDSVNILNATEWYT